MTGIVQKSAQPLTEAKTFFYTGTDVVVPGQPLVYDMGAAIGSFGLATSRGNAVCKPKSGSVLFAGWASNNTPFLTNPDDGSTATPNRYIGGEIPVRDQVGYVMVKANCTAGATLLAVKSDGSVTDGLSAAVLATAHDGVALLPGEEVVAVAMQTIDTSGGAALVLVRWR